MNFLDDRLPPRFWDKVIPEPNSGCWLWIGATSSRGYGYFTIKKPISARAHRMTYAVANGSPIADGLDIDHLCRVRNCCNPHHLEAVSCRENLLRGETLAAANAAKTHCKRGHELTGGNLRSGFNGKRACRECSNARRRTGGSL